MKLHKVLLVALFFTVFCFGGCYKLTFTNGTAGATANQTPPRAEWHHIGIIKLVEFSDPVDLKERCKGKNWTSVLTDMTFVQGLIGAIPYNYIYNPRGVEWSCEE